MELTELIFVPLVLFLVLVMPLWIVFHYLTLWKRERRQHAGEVHRDQELQELAHRLEDRLDAIESILDNDAPAWRTHK